MSYDDVLIVVDDENATTLSCLRAVPFRGGENARAVLMACARHDERRQLKVP